MTRPMKWALVPMLALVASPWVANDLAAQPSERRDDRKEHREDRREDRKERREELKDEWKKKRAEWKQKREARRKERREDLKERWGDLLLRPAVREELRVHARRMARLQRIEFLAEATGKPELKTKADKLIAEEDIRFNARMAALKTEAGK
jgi:hypothetical protein